MNEYGRQEMLNIESGKKFYGHLKQQHFCLTGPFFQEDLCDTVLNAGITMTIPSVSGSISALFCRCRLIVCSANVDTLCRH